MLIRNDHGVTIRVGIAVEHDKVLERAMHNIVRFVFLRLDDAAEDTAPFVTGALLQVLVAPGTPEMIHGRLCPGVGLTGLESRVGSARRKRSGFSTNGFGGRHGSAVHHVAEFFAGLEEGDRFGRHGDLLA